MKELWTAVRNQQPDVNFGTCVWRLDDGKYLANEDGDLLSIQGQLGDTKLESKMRDAAKYYFDLDEGEPKWIVGARKITDSEYEDQMAELQDGRNPDPVDLYRQALGN